MDQAVCRNCWTWYGQGTTVCPSCKVPLFPGSASAAPGDQQPPAGAAPAPSIAATETTSARTRIPVLLAGAGAILVAAVIGFAVVANLNLGGPIKASDGSFSVKNPGGWYPTTWSLFQGYTVVLSIEALKSGGKSDFAVLDLGEQLPLDQIPAAWEALPTSGHVPAGMHVGGMTSRTVGGAPAYIGDVGGVKDGTPFQGQLAFINYNNRTYIVALASTPSAYSSMRQDYETLLSSWTWLH